MIYNSWFKGQKIVIRPSAISSFLHSLTEEQAIERHNKYQPNFETIAINSYDNDNENKNKSIDAYSITNKIMESIGKAIKDIS